VSHEPNGPVRWNPPAHELGAHNAILSGSLPKRTTAFPGALSIKYMPAGFAVWSSGRRRWRVEGDAFLVLNHGTVYELERPADEPTRSFCPFFARGFVEAAERALRAGADALLDQPEATPTGVFELREQLHDRRVELAAPLRALAREVGAGAGTELSIEAGFVELAAALVLTREREAGDLGRVPALRASTRSELHARLQRGRERMHDGLGERLDLAAIARAAGMALHHFHRAFRALHGETPHAYLTRLRLERAARLLVATEWSVTAICAAVGFESLGSFSTLFRRRFGRAPSAFRKNREAGEGRGELASRA
jgi:AraC-like DNA-binding protein